jgi:hypothetical protein
MKLLAWLRSVAAKFFGRSRTAQDVDEELRAHIQSRAEDLERSGLDPATAERRARTRAAQVARLCRRRDPDAGAGYWRQRCCVWRTECALPAAAERAPGREPVRESSMRTDKYGYQSYPNYLDLRDRNRSFDGLAVFAINQEVLTQATIRPAPGTTKPAATTSTYCGIQPYLGRFFHGSDEHGPNSAPYIVLSYAYWHSHFGTIAGWWAAPFC